MKLTDLKYAYLSTPYRKHPKGIFGAYIEACKVAAKLDLAGINFYAPVVDTHGIAVHGGINAKDHSFWLQRDFKRAEYCDAMLIAEMDGWQESFGIAEEAKFFRSKRRPIINIDPHSLAITTVWRPND